MTLAKWLALSGLALDIVGVVVIGLRSERWMFQFWRSAPARFDTQAHKVMYQGAWWAIALGFALQAIAVLVQLQGQLERVDALQRKLGRIVPYLFPYLSGKRRAGQRRCDFRKAWIAACTAAGLAGRLRHDFRRTAVRNLERAGVSRSQAMKITGHRTEAVYRRYAIVSEADLREAVQKLDGYIHGDSRVQLLDERRATM